VGLKAGFCSELAAASGAVIEAGGAAAILVAIIVGEADGEFGAASLHQRDSDGSRAEGLPLGPVEADPAPDVPSFISRIRSSYAPGWRGLQRLSV